MNNFCRDCGCTLVFNADHVASCPSVNLRFCSKEQLPTAIVETLTEHFNRLEDRLMKLEWESKLQGFF